MSIAATTKALEFYGYSTTPTDNEIVKVVDKTRYAKDIWEYFLNIDDAENYLKEGKLDEDDFIEVKLDITPLKQTFKNKQFWTPYTKLKNPASALVIEEFEENETTTIDENAESILQNHYGKTIEPTEEEKLAYLNQLTVKELSELAKAIGIKSTGKKVEIINRIAPEIPTEHVPKKIKLNQSFFDHLNDLKLIYIKEAAKALSTLPISLDVKADYISDALFLTHAPPSIDEIKKVIKPYQNFHTPSETVLRRPLRKSDKIGFQAIAFASIMTILVIYFVSDLPWWTYLLLWLVAWGMYFNDFLKDEANKNLTDR